MCPRCSDLVTWDEDDFYSRGEEDAYNSNDEVEHFLPIFSVMSSWTLITAMTRWNIFSIPYFSFVITVQRPSSWTYSSHGSKCDCSEVLKIKEGSLKLFTESCYCGHNSKAVHFLHFLKEISQQSWLDKLAVFSQKKNKI